MPCIYPISRRLSNDGYVRLSPLATKGEDIVLVIIIGAKLDHNKIPLFFAAVLLFTLTTLLHQDQDEFKSIKIIHNSLVLSCISDFNPQLEYYLSRSKKLISRSQGEYNMRQVQSQC